VVQAALGKKQDPFSKITNRKRAGGVAQGLPSKYKALSSNPSTMKERKRLPEAKRTTLC
jgi:hypothetical protein